MKTRPRALPTDAPPDLPKSGICSALPPTQPSDTPENNEAPPERTRTMPPPNDR